MVVIYINIYKITKKYYQKKITVYPILFLFQQELVRRGILTRAGMFLCGSHQTSDIDKTLSAFQEAMEVVSAAVKSNKVLDWLDGDVLEPVIRAKQ